MQEGDSFEAARVCTHNDVCISPMTSLPASHMNNVRVPSPILLLCPNTHRQIQRCPGSQTCTSQPVHTTALWCRDLNNNIRACTNRRISAVVAAGTCMVHKQVWVEWTTNNRYYNKILKDWSCLAHPSVLVDFSTLADRPTWMHACMHAC